MKRTVARLLIALPLLTIPAFAHAHMSAECLNAILQNDVRTFAWMRAALRDQKYMKEGQYIQDLRRSMREANRLCISDKQDIRKKDGNKGE